MRNVYFDTETTGFKPGQIAQLSAIIEEDGNVTAVNYFFQIESIDSSAEKLLGRGIKFYREQSGGIGFIHKAAEINQIFSGANLVAHNLPFDETFMRAEFSRTGTAMPYIAGRYDTMKKFRDILQIPSKKYGIKNPKLEEVVDYLGINKEKAAKYCKMLFNSSIGNSVDVDYHDARLDATMLFLIVQLEREKENGTKDRDCSWTNTFCNK